VDLAAQAELEESREIRAALDKDQHYYFKMKARKDKGGVRIQVKFRLSLVAESVFSSVALLRYNDAFFVSYIS